MSKDNFDFESFKEEAMKGLYEGKKMGGTDGVFAPMLKHLLESMLEESWTTTYRRIELPERSTVKMGRRKKRSGAFNQDISNWRAVVTETALSSQK